MPSYQEVQALLRQRPRRWLITGVAGFIGSNLLEALLKLDQQVTGLDNFATGHARNMDEVRQIVGAERSRNFTFIEGDIRDRADCRRACAGVDFVLHQAALGPVPRSLADPLTTHDANVTRFVIQGRRRAPFAGRHLQGAQFAGLCAYASHRRRAEGSDGVVYQEPAAVRLVESAARSTCSPDERNGIGGRIVAGEGSRNALRFFRATFQRADKKRPAAAGLFLRETGISWRAGGG